MRSISIDFRIGKQVLVNGLLFVIKGFEEPVAVVLQRVGFSVTTTFTRNELARMAMAGQYCEIDAPPPSEKDCRPPFNLNKINAEKRARVLRRLAYVNDAKTLYPIGPKTRPLALSIKHTAERINDTKPPSPHSVYRWLKRFIISGHDPAAFARDAGAVRTRKSRLPDGARALIEHHLMDVITSNKGESIRSGYDAVMAKVAGELGYMGFKSIDGSPRLVSSVKSIEQKRFFELALEEDEINE